MRKRTKSREATLQILYQIEITQDPWKSAVKDYWESHVSLDAEIQEFANQLVQGTLEHVQEIDRWIQQSADHWDLNRMASVDRNILRLAVCELLYMNEIPPKVSINEAVELAKKYGDKDSSKFVNGILDKIYRDHQK